MNPLPDERRLEECPRCRYSLREALVGYRCPECGLSLDRR